MSSKLNISLPLKGWGETQGTILLGFSGGADSTALLHFLITHEPQVHDRIVATHCNFHLRGEESDRDEQFCCQFCKSHGVKLLVRHFDTRGYMDEHHVSLELAARELRYAWWSELLQSDPDAILLTAHHQDDNIETLLFNLMRGTGINGMCGIRNHDRIFRPLLEVSQQEILEYLREEQQDFVTDSTNLIPEATRNKIRLQLLPLMEQILPQVRTGIATTIHHLKQTRALAEERMDEIFATTRQYNVGPNIWEEWDSTDHPELIHEWTARHTSASHRVLQHGTLLYTEPLTYEPDSFVQETLQVKPAFSPDYEILDADKVQMPLTLRHWQTGDRFQPLGMTGTRLVSDIFSDLHLSPMQKFLCRILTDASGTILLLQLPGSALPSGKSFSRLSDTVKTTSATTRFLLISADNDKHSCCL